MQVLRGRAELRWRCNFARNANFNTFRTGQPIKYIFRYYNLRFYSHLSSPVSWTPVEQEWIGRLPGLDQLWSRTRGRPDVHIAVLDGPLDRSFDFPAAVAPAGAVEHGTHVHSILSGSNDGTVPGIAPECTISQIAIFEAPDRDGRYVCTQERLASGIRDALARKANVINISAAQQADPLSLSAELAGALHDAIASDALVVAAAGNQGCACETIPASVS